MSTQKSGNPTIVQRAVAFALQQRVVRAFLLYSEHRGSMLADSITYRALFSVFAAVLLGFSIAALWLGGNPEAMSALVSALDDAVPGLTDVVDPSEIDAPAGFSVVGAVALVGLVGAAISAIGSLRTALLVLADRLHEDGFFLWVMLRNLLVAVGFGGLLVISAVLSVGATASISMLASFLHLDEISGVTQVLTRFASIAVVLIIDTLAIALVFKLLSKVEAPSRALWCGAVLGGFGLTVLQELSGLFVRGATSNPLLASFAALIALLLWFNLSAQVILIASSYIITATAESHDRVRMKYGARTLTQRRRQRAEDVVQAANAELRAAQETEANERSDAR